MASQKEIILQPGAIIIGLLAPCPAILPRMIWGAKED